MASKQRPQQGKIREKEIPDFFSFPASFQSCSRAKDLRFRGS
tara:strand:+ start:1308 stop:1433 length:126 start_codon:yes stop_codon:yes gene_type:complete